MRRKAVVICIAVFFAVLVQSACAEELYIITVSDGTEIVVKNYKFTDAYVEYTTENDLPGFIKKDDFLSIANMIGVPSGEATSAESIEKQKKREIVVWIVAGLVLLALYSVFMLIVIKRKKKKEGEVDIYFGRTEKDTVTQGHLSFTYKGLFGREQQRTVEVISAWEEEGVLYISGFCTVRDERKIFRADRIVGKVTDMSSNHRAVIDEFFVDAED